VVEVEGARAGEAARERGSLHLVGSRRGVMAVTVLIAAHNEEQSIAATLDSIASQTRRPDRVVLAADRCTDRTVELARAVAIRTGMPLLVFDTVDNKHRKSSALNQAWARTRSVTDLFVCIDADTVLPPNAIDDWEGDFIVHQKLAGCSAKFTMLSSKEMAGLADQGWLPRSAGDLPDLSFRERMWCRLQKAEFAKWTDTALSRSGRWTSVLAGTACAIRASSLDEIVQQRVDEGKTGVPWTNESEVEDFELTYRLRSLDYTCRVSSTVRAYTGAMLSFRTLWAQRLKWQVGTVRDLRRIGVNDLTMIDWWQQGLGLLSVVLRVVWVGLLCFGLAFTGHVALMHYWWVFPIAFVIFDVREAWRIPHRTWADIVTAAILLPQEFFAWIRAAWFTWSWVEVLAGRTHDRWALQIAAEGGS